MRKARPRHGKDVTGGGGSTETGAGTEEQNSVNPRPGPRGGDVAAKEGASSTASRTLLAIIGEASTCGFSVIIPRFLCIVVCQSGASFSTVFNFATTHSACHVSTKDIRSLAKALACIRRKQLPVPDMPQPELCVDGERREGDGRLCGWKRWCSLFLCTTSSPSTALFHESAHGAREAPNQSSKKKTAGRDRPPSVRLDPLVASPPTPSPHPSLDDNNARKRDGFHHKRTK